MKIELIKMKVDDGYFSYKYMPLRFCCNALQKNNGIILTDEDFVDEKREYKDEDGGNIPQLCITQSEIIQSYEDEWEEIHNYPIRYCPHCGEKIEIEVIADEIDISKKIEHLNNAITELRKIGRETDSRKQYGEIINKINVLNNRINYFYEFGEYDEK